MSPGTGEFTAGAESPFAKYFVRGNHHRLVSPAVQFLGLFLSFDLQGAVLGAPLPVRQSFLMFWPHLTGLISVTILLFALG